VNKETKVKKVNVVIIIIFILIVFLCGCTENNISSYKIDISKFIGTWSGNMETFMFNFRDNRTKVNNTDFRNISSSNITKLEFTIDNLDMTILIGNETKIMSFTYMVKGNRLVLSPKFNGGRLDGEPPTDGERPPFNDENPFNGEPPNNGTRPSFDGERPFRESSYGYNFNEEYDVLYLDGSPFTKN